MHFLIDGENFRHQIAAVLFEKKLILAKNNDFAFDFVGFCKEVLHNDKPKIVYYTTKIKQPIQKIPLKLAKTIEAISIANRKWIARLANQHIEIVKAGYLRIRESNACIHCGKKTLVLQEKGVDVRVATDLVLMARKNIPDVVLGSSDSDIIPAMQAARALGAKVTYVCYAGKLNRSVAGVAHKTITYDDAVILKYFKEIINV
jgi:uncharacterized LabA/DUF88 family protein